MSPGQKSGRQDRVILMARGLSARMGVPKGLLRVPGAGPSFIRHIADLYLNAGFPVDVVTRRETAEVYRGELPADDDLRILTAAAGGDTALTLLIAWRSCLAAGVPGSHFWAHPVDLPLVTMDTVARLRDHSRRDPGSIIRPVWQGIPGHPVVLPGTVLEALDGQERWQAGPLRDFLSESAEGNRPSRIVQLDVDDEGTVRDFDTPADIDPARPTSEKRGLQ